MPGRPPARKPRRLLTPLLLAAGCLLLGAVLVLKTMGSTESLRQQARDSGLSYARTHMVWETGPSVLWDRTTHLSALPTVLRDTAPNLQHDINMPALIRSYGAARDVDLVILHGRYNTLPPDEGVETTGQVAAVVDLHSGRVLLLMN